MVTDRSAELLDAVRRFVDRRLIPLEAQVDDAGEISSALVEELRSLQ